jgi:hypothetical protein
MAERWRGDSLEAKNKTASQGSRKCENRAVLIPPSQKLPFAKAKIHIVIAASLPAAAAIFLRSNNEKPSAI